MNNYQTSEKSTLKEKAAIISLVLGIVGTSFCIIISMLYWFHLPIPTKLGKLIWEISDTLWIIFLYVAFPSSILGLIFGRIGFNSSKKKLAKIGMVFSGIGIFISSVTIGFQIWSLLQGT